MELKVFSIFDDKGAVYAQPFFMATTGQAIRTFSDACKDNRMELCKHPEDFSLYELGVFDTSSGKLEAVIPPKYLARAIEFSKDGGLYASSVG